MVRKTKSIAIVIILILVLVTALPACGLFRRLKKDESKSVIVHTRVENAQYMPEVENLTKVVGDTNEIAPPLNASNQSENQPTYNDVSVSKIDRAGFIDILNTLGKIEGQGAGKYLGYDVFEIKNEISFVVKNAPYFNQWFRLPTMRADEGYIAIPYYENWAFFVESDSEAEDVTVTRVCHKTTFRSYDVDDNSSVDNGLQYQVMQVRYYFDELDREVVECYVYNVAEVNGNSVPLSFQYLKNVKDTSLTLYNITTAERYNNKNDDDGWDIREKYPYGTTRDFVELNYDNEGQIQLLKISQILPTEIYRLPPTTDIAFYSITDIGVQFLAYTYDYAPMNLGTHILSLHSYQSQFDEFDAAHYFSVSGSLGNYERKKAKVDYTDLPTRTLASAQTLGNENALLRSLQNTVTRMAHNLTIESQYIVAFENVFEQRTMFYAPTLLAEKALYDLLTDMAVYIIDNSYLKNKWGSIFSDSEKAVTAPVIKGPFIDRGVPIVDFYSRMDFYEDNSGEVCPFAEYRIVDQQYADCKMRLALRSADGEYTLIFLYSTTTDTGGCMRYGNDDSMLEVSLDKAGEYTAVFVLTRLVDDVETVVLDTLQTPYVSRFVGVHLPNTVAENGDIISYEVYGQGGMLVISAIKLDSED